MNTIASLAAIDNLESVSRYSTTNPLQENKDQTNHVSFESLLDSAMKMIHETEDYSNAVEEEVIKYASGESTNLHDLMIAQQKANTTLQYTVAVKNTAVEAYRTLMNLQF